MSTLLKEFPELRKCIEGGHINAVKNAIKMGNQLHTIKAVIKGRKESWLDFIKDKFSISIRSCQNFMKLAKTPIHENHYKFGIEGLLELIRAGRNVSHSVLDPCCQGCLIYGQNGDMCTKIIHNQTGNCPCTDCEYKGFCNFRFGRHYWKELLKEQKGEEL